MRCTTDCATLAELLPEYYTYVLDDCQLFSNSESLNIVRKIYALLSGYPDRIYIGGMIMSYVIHYANEESSIRKTNNRWFGIVGAVLVIAVCLLAVSWYLPQQVRQFREALFPWTKSDVQAVFAQLRDNVRQGQTLGDAVTVFCKDIIHMSELP